MDSIPKGLNPEWTELRMGFVTCLAEGGGIGDVPLDVLSSMRKIFLVRFNLKVIKHTVVIIIVKPGF